MRPRVNLTVSLIVTKYHQTSYSQITNTFSVKDINFTGFDNPAAIFVAPGRNSDRFPDSKNSGWNFSFESCFFLLGECFLSGKYFQQLLRDFSGIGFQARESFRRRRSRRQSALEFKPKKKSFLSNNCTARVVEVLARAVEHLGSCPA